MKQRSTSPTTVIAVESDLVALYTENRDELARISRAAAQDWAECYAWVENLGMYPTGEDLRTAFSRALLMDDE